MLILSRKVGERIIVGDNIVISVVAIVRGRTSLGIEAPTDIRVARAELLVKDNNQADKRDRRS